MGGAPRWQGRTHIVGVGGHTHMGGDPEVAGSYSHSGGGRTHMGGAPRWQGRTHIVGVGGHTHMGGAPEVAESYSHGRGPRGGRVVLT